jgi:GDP-4-dehydro-6-deoxy-D-mannose reductase
MASAKLAEDLLCYQYYDNFKLKICRVRLFNCTGTRKIGDITADFTKRAVELEKKGETKLVVGNLTSTRAIIDARDVAEGLIVLSEKGQPGEAYNICSSHVFQMHHVIECIEKVTGVHYELVTDRSSYAQPMKTLRWR